MTKPIFVFGSNEAGIHGAGAACHAHKNLGAIWGKPEGHYGDTYAIPTKSATLRTLRRSVIEEYVETFKAYARAHPELTFEVTRIGCGLAGFKDRDIAPLFGDAPFNCQFDTAWLWMLPNHRSWGTF